MSSRPPSTSTRLLAPLALIVCAVALLAVITASVGDDEPAGGQATGTTTDSAQSPRGEGETPRRRQRKVYVVQPGDTLGGIAEQTGVPVTTIQELNPEVDPQALIAGQRITLRE